MSIFGIDPLHLNAAMMLMDKQAFINLLISILNDDSPIAFVKSAVIKDALKLLNDLIENKFITISIKPSDQPQFLVIGKKDNHDDTNAFIILPPQYCIKCFSDMPMQIGMITHIASHSKDYWNLKLDKNSNKRAFSMEAQILIELFDEFPDLKEKSGTYQQKLLEKYPEGIMSALEFHYKTRPFDVKGGPPWPAKNDKVESQ